MDYQQITEYRNLQSAFARRLGIVVKVLGPGSATAVKTIEEKDTNPLGVAHGAVLFAIADTACGTAAVSYGYKAVTLNATYNFLQSGKVGDVVTAEAVEIKRGRTVSVYECTLKDQDGRMLGCATMNFYNLKEPLEA